MNELVYKELIDILEQMINDKVQLIHGGQIIEWEETKIPEVVQKVKENLEFKNTHLVQNISLGNNNN